MSEIVPEVENTIAEHFERMNDMGILEKLWFLLVTIWLGSIFGAMWEDIGTVPECRTEPYTWALLVAIVAFMIIGYWYIDALIRFFKGKN